LTLSFVIEEAYVGLAQAILNGLEDGG